MGTQRCRKPSGSAGALPAPPHPAVFRCRAAQYRQGSSWQLMDHPLPHMSSSWLPGWDLASSQTAIPDMQGQQRHVTDENIRDSLFLGSHPLVLIPGMRAGSLGAEVLLVSLHRLSPDHVSIPIAKAPHVRSTQLEVYVIRVYLSLQIRKCAQM